MAVRVHHTKFQHHKNQFEAYCSTVLDLDIVLDKDKQALKLLCMFVGGNPVVLPGSLGCCGVFMATNVSICHHNL